MHAIASQSLYLVAYLTKAHTGLNCEIVRLGYEQNTTPNLKKTLHNFYN